MEVIIPFNEMDNFEFNSARSSPFASPPSTPKPFNGDFYFSAPPSPSHLSQFYRGFDSLFVADDEVKGEFAFNVSQELEISSVSAEELFDGGMIKPYPVLQIEKKNRVFSPRKETEYSVSQTVKKNRVFSPRKKKDEETEYSVLQTQNHRESRGKQRVSLNGLSNSSSRRSARSLSPIRVSQYPWEEEEEIMKQSLKSNSICSVLTSASSKGSKKWRFKDFFLFRSASEGRASSKDPLKKYTIAGYKERKISSYKGNESSVPSSSSSSKAIATTRTIKGKVSAHELHYTVNRALSSDLKKKTLLPYKQGIFGQLAFNPAVHAMANGFGLSRKK